MSTSSSAGQTSSNGEPPVLGVTTVVRSPRVNLMAVGFSGPPPAPAAPPLPPAPPAPPVPIVPPEPAAVVVELVLAASVVLVVLLVLLVPAVPSVVEPPSWYFTTSGSPSEQALNVTVRAPPAVARSPTVRISVHRMCALIPYCGENIHDTGGSFIPRRCSFSQRLHKGMLPARSRRSAADGAATGTRAARNRCVRTC